MNFSFKKNVIVIVIAALLALGVGGAAVAIGVSSMPANRVSRYMGAAERYLSEMNYEQAIIEFQKILEIEPMNVDAIIGLANAYIRLGDTEKALEILQDGYERTEDKRIRAKIEKLTNPDEQPVSSTTLPESTANKPFESKPEYGSMGKVTIAGTELDIATTTSLLIYNKDNDNDHRGVGLFQNSIINDPEKYGYKAVYITEELSKFEMEKLSDLSQLTSLSIDCVELTDISSLAKLTKLNSLGLTGNQISDITPLANLENLTSLDLCENKIHDIDVLANLTRISTLGLHGNQITDISPLANLTNISSLSIGNNQISDISPLENISNTKPKHFMIGNNRISDISSLAKIPNLIYLSLNDNQISNISSLSELTNLETLYLYNNQISNISSLRELTNLKILGLSHNEISNSDIEQLKLWLPECKIMS